MESFAKRFISLLLCLVLVLCTPSSALSVTAADDTSSESILTEEEEEALTDVEDIEISAEGASEISDEDSEEILIEDDDTEDAEDTEAVDISEDAEDTEVSDTSECAEDTAETAESEEAVEEEEDVSSDETAEDTEDIEDSQEAEDAVSGESAEETESMEESGSTGSEESIGESEAAESGETAASSSETSGTSVVMADLSDILYVYIDASVVGLGEELNIVIGLSDTAAEVVSAVLTITSPETGVSLEIDSAAVSTNAVLFTVVFEEEDQAVNYELTSLVYTLADSENTYLIEMETDEGDYYFDVVTAETMETLESASETADNESVTVYTINENGSLEASEQLSEALDDADAQIGSEYSLLSTSDELVIALDPGHGGSEEGATANGLVEAELNWKIAKYCKAELEEYEGVTVVLTRSKNETVSLSTRVSRAVEAGADVLISIHCNAVGTGGAEVWVPNESSYMYSLHTIGTELGEAILEQLVALGLRERGVYTRDSENGSEYSDGSTADYYGIIRLARKSGLAAIIIEHAYVDDDTDAAFLKKTSNLKKLGIADATGIADYYGLIKTGTLTIESVTVSDSLTSAVLVWEEFDSAKGYRIYRSSDGSTWERVKTITDGSTVTWTDKNLEAGETYYYKIRAYAESNSGSKTYGSYSDVVQITTLPSTVQISSAAAADDYSSITLSWKQASRADGYYIYRKDESGTYARVQTISGTSTVSWIDSDVESGQSYTYKIYAYKQLSDGSIICGNVSSEVSVLTRPEQVTLLSAEFSSSAQVVLTWSCVDGATSYEIYRSVNGGSYEILTELSDVSATSYTDTTVSLTDTYMYKIRAVKTLDIAADQNETQTKSVKGNFSSAVSVTAGPSTVTITSLASTTKGKIKITWEEVSGADGYVIYRSVDGGSYTKIKTITDGDTVSYTNSSVEVGKVYRYKIKAYKTYDSGKAYSTSYSNVKKMTARPGKVSISSASRTSGGYVKVTWEEVSSADGYVIYRSKNGGSYKKVKTITSGSTLSWTDKTVTAGRVYRYKIKAYVTVGDTNYKSSSYSSVKKITAKPATVKISSVSSTSTAKATVKWKSVSGATGYQVAYRVKGTSKWYYTTVSTNKKVFTKLKSKKYYVKVRAYRTYNGTKYYGSWSSQSYMKVK